MPTKHILFLDGDCVFCQKSSRVLHQYDRHKKLYFATLQGETADILPDEWRVLENADGESSGAAVLAEETDAGQRKFWRGADAMLRAFYLAGGILKLLWALHYIPRPIRDGGYAFLSKNRHRLVGKHATCPMPSEEFRKHLLP